MDLQPLYQLFEAHSDPILAEQMKRYMAYQFDFYGIQKPLRSQLQKRFWKQYGFPTIDQLTKTIKDLWQHPKREPQYTAIDIIDRLKDQLPQDFIQILQWLITTKSWWDSVDLLATKFVFKMFELYPNLESHYFEVWVESDNIWLNRTALIYQLKRKEKTDIEKLTYAIEKLKDKNEFFIQKAIGWALREYSKFNPNFVRKFVKTNELSPLARREALRYLNRNKS